MDKKAPAPPAAAAYFETIKHLPLKVRIAARKLYKIHMDLKATQRPAPKK